MKFLLLSTWIILLVVNTLVQIQGIPPLQILDERLDLVPNEEPETVQIDPRYKLPEDVIPSYYRLQIRPIIIEDPSGELYTAPGSVRITVKCLNPTNIITLHSSSSTVQIVESSISIRKLADPNLLAIEDFPKDDEKDFFSIKLVNELEKDAEYEITIAQFTTTISQTDLNGLYVSYYIDAETGARRNLATTQFQPSRARKAFPCFDEPAMKAQFEISVGRHESYPQALSNMDWVSTSDIPGVTGWKWDHFRRSSVKMSTYLVAFIVSDFTFAEAEGKLGEKPIRAYGPKHLIEQGGGVFAANASSTIIQYYQDFVKINYSLPKLDSVAIPQFSAGAMENWGLNTYRTEYLIHIPGENTEAERKKIGQVLSHEITHQWYGNLVTCKTWSYTWLNEGFARFLQYRGMNAGTPEFNTLIAIISDATQLAMPFDHGDSTHPMVQEVTTPEEASNIFSRITYEKAASILRMVENVLTTPVFDDSIRDYLSRMQENSAVQTDLFESFQKLADQHNSSLNGVKIQTILESWTHQTGYPLVRVSSSGNNKLYFQQEKFRLNKGSKPTTNEESGSWYIPVKIVGANNPNFEDKTPTLWIPQEATTISFTNQDVDASKWLIANPDVTGYYRVLYDAGLRNRIKSQLDTNPEVISAGTRSQLLDDYFTFAGAGYAPIEATLDLTTFLHQEKTLVTWTPVLTHLRPILTKFSTIGEARALEAFKIYFASKINGALDLIGWEQPQDQKGADVILRSQLLDFACTLNQTKCVENSKKLFEDWALTPTNRSIILPDIRPVVFCSAVAAGDQAVWNSAYGLYRAEKFAATKTQLFRALACSQNLNTLNSLLQKAIDNEGDLDMPTAAVYVAANSVGRQLTYNLMKAEFHVNDSSFGPSQFASVVSTLSNYWNQQSQYDDLENFINEKGIGGSPRTSLNASLSKIKANMEWFNTFRDPMVSWLERQNSGLL